MLDFPRSIPVTRLVRMVSILPILPHLIPVAACPIDVDNEQSALDLLSTDKTANLLRHLQKAKLNGDLVKSSDPAALSKRPYKINNPLATHIDEASDWQDTQRRMFNRWAGQDSAQSARIASGNDHASVLDSPSKASDALINATSQQRVKNTQRESTNPFGFWPIPNYSRYPGSMAETSIMPPPRSSRNSSGSGVGAGSARQHEDNERLRLFASTAQLPSAVQDQDTPTQAPDAMSSKKRSLFDDIRDRRDSAISMPNLQQALTQPLPVPPRTMPTNALLLRPFYGPKPRTAATASSVGHVSINVQAGSGVALVGGNEPASDPNSSSRNDDSV
ncbi:hypothetical protein LTR15_012473 [Elasticomyces elasticus]|nr:hypothetical protein LTR15_012473 [Elasticomyces elasticus]